MRVYVPTTLTGLAAVHATGEVGPAPLTAFAVTPALREWYVEGDIEELEYAAMAEAARASLRLVDLDPTAARRRVVLAAEVPDAAVTPAPELERSVVRVGVAIAMRQLASVHVDAPEAEDDVRAAADAIIAADLGSEDAAFTVDGAEGHELLWYATQEIPDLLA
jgi:hypothetical protein